jgi:hypothetical protein
MSGQGTVIIAVIAVTMVQFAVAEIIEMVAVRHAFVPCGLVIAGAGNGRAGRGIGIADRNHMFIIMVAVPIVQVSIVQIIDVAFVQNSDVTAILPVNMSVFAGVG